MYTKNDTYAKWAEKSFDWMSQSPLLQADGTINDGTSMETTPMCKDADHTQWTYNYGIMIAGAAYVRYFNIGRVNLSANRRRCTTTQMVQ
jgi:predicted alpha-1,6-mannanase (GH76 family)